MSRQTTILDGSMGQQLNAMGAPFRMPEWSALALMEDPGYVRRAHDAYVAAGADVLTTNAYALVPFHIGEERFAADAARLANLAGRLAREAADAAGDGPVRVAGCLPPLFGSYRPDLFEPDRAPDILSVLIDNQMDHVDLWLAETMSSVAEVDAVAEALAGDRRPLWLAFTLKDDDPDPSDPRLRSRESVADAVHAAIGVQAAAILFNCSQPEVMGQAVADASAVLRDAGADLPIGVYANTFPPMSEDTQANIATAALRSELDPPAYLEFARDWVACGATILGGCCGIGPDHIAVLRKALA